MSKKKTIVDLSYMLTKKKGEPPKKCSGVCTAIDAYKQGSITLDTLLANYNEFASYKAIPSATENEIVRNLIELVDLGFVKVKEHYGEI